MLRKRGFSISGGRGMMRGKTKTVLAACIIHPTKRHDIHFFRSFLALAR